jgi:Protein phosphatase 2C
VIWSWIDDARDQIRAAATRRNQDAREFAATLVCILAGEDETVVLHIGDGAAVLNIEGEWTVPSWPESGEYASTTFFVTDDPAPKLRITRVTNKVRALALFSDGLERLALNFAEHRAHAPFFEGMIRSVMAGSVGQNFPLSAALAAYLDSGAVVARTDDDKSIILAAQI